MRISGNANLETAAMNRPAAMPQSIGENVVQQGNQTTMKQQATTVERVQNLSIDNSEETKAKVQEAVDKMNEMLDVNNSASKFMFHEGLERYYVTVVDRETEEVVKEIPPKRLLDAFYEMQKMLGMIVDEKI
ncbi:flagellar protein FlaG [Solibacillus sp. MA9]|uniref:Flagellar protein FlaG n=1 Tax=Solibacillus palustris TaxID=2908203 RepID=A0ABS9U938_9BACL|nr:flagellar protein FlaG [Solibacillus sp. MA9]MCH7320655.1 flagellar protein FlaG [Solibacillus sp. MA9]